MLWSPYHDAAACTLVIAFGWMGKRKYSIIFFELHGPFSRTQRMVREEEVNVLAFAPSFVSIDTCESKNSLTRSTGMMAPVGISFVPELGRTDQELYSG